MKTIFKITFIISLLFIFTSCNSDSVEEQEEQEEQENYYIKAKIDGESFYSDFPVTLGSLWISNKFSILGENNDHSRSIRIYIEEFNGSGTYVMGLNTNNENNFFITKSNTTGGGFFTDKNNGTGTVTITENGNILTGTFSCVANSISTNATTTVTQGTFRANKQL